MLCLDLGSRDGASGPGADCCGLLLLPLTIAAGTVGLFGEGGGRGGTGKESSSSIPASTMV